MSPITPSTTTSDVMCAETAPPAPASPATFGRLFPRVFPPADADAEQRRAWLKDSPWPEVVFASAG